MRNRIKESVFILFIAMVLFISCEADSGSGDNSDLTSPVPGTDITFSNIASDSFTVNWGAASDDRTVQEELSYKLVMAANEEEIDTIEEADAIEGDALISDWSENIVSVDVTGLVDGMNYCFAVLVKDDNGNISIYTPGVVSTLDITEPTPGDETSFDTITSSSVTVSWGQADDNSTLQNQLSYKLVMASTAAEIDTIVEADAVVGTGLVMDWTVNCTSYPVSSLADNTSYYFTVLVQDGGGNKSIYAPKMTTTLNKYCGTWIFDEDFGDEFRKQTIIITENQITFIKEWHDNGGPATEREEWTMTYILGSDYNDGNLLDLTTVSAYMTLCTPTLVTECNTYGDCVDGASIKTFALNVPKNVTAYVNDYWYDIIKIENNVLYIGDGNCNKWSNGSTLGSTAGNRYISYDASRGFTKE